MYTLSSSHPSINKFPPVFNKHSKTTVPTTQDPLWICHLSHYLFYQVHTWLLSGSTMDPNLYHLCLFQSPNQTYYFLKVLVFFPKSFDFYFLSNSSSLSPLFPKLHFLKSLDYSLKLSPFSQNSFSPKSPTILLTF